MSNDVEYQGIIGAGAEAEAEAEDMLFFPMESLRKKLGDGVAVHM
ncbi:hypothetical protein [Paenibacillus farraposensis]|nr:hypothetical protein [Paenibacillus farraposensis]